MRLIFVFTVAGILSLLMSSSVLAQQAKAEGSSCPESALAGTESKWNGWGAGEANLRFQSNPGFTTSQVARLRLKWAFGFPSDTLAYAQPTLVWGRVFVGSAGGFVYSLNPNVGCTYWKFRAEAGVLTNGFR
jgi:polyvinyl alcohol dehydrogenase (cytochrome)